MMLIIHDVESKKVNYFNNILHKTNTNTEAWGVSSIHTTLNRHGITVIIRY